MENKVNRMTLGNYICWDLGIMSTLFTVCKFPFAIKQLEFVYDHPDMKYSPVQKLRGLDFLAALSFNPLPISEIQIMQTLDKKGYSLQATTFEKDRAYELLLDFARGTDLIYADPRPCISAVEPHIMGNLRRVYPIIELESLEKDLSPSTIFGFFRYNSFLKTYEGLSNTKSTKIACEKFNVDAEEDEEGFGYG